VVLSSKTPWEVTMNKFLISTVALVMGFSMPTLAASIGRGPAPPVRDIPGVSGNAEANSEQRPSIEEQSQSPDATHPIKDPGLH